MEETPRWEAWPDMNESPVANEQDSDFYYRRFNEDSSRLFSTQSNLLEIFRVCLNNEEFVARSIDNAESLQNALQVNKTSSKEAYYIFRQENSWGRFLITKESFRKVLACHTVFHPFLDCLHGFGFKTEEDYRIWDGFHVLISDRGMEERASCHYELCYNIRYVERNGRGTGDPWSLRQTGIYQKYYPAAKRSVWILLEPSKTLQERLRTILNSKRSDSDVGERSPMLLHTLILFMTASNWGSYLDDLDSEVKALDYKGCFSSVGVRSLYDYSLTFADSQRLQLVRQKLFRILSVLDSSLGIAQGCETHVGKLSGLGCTQAFDRTSTAFEMYAGQIRVHRRRVVTMLEYSSGTATLLSKILEYRNNEVIVKTSQTVQDHLDIIKRIAFQSSEENRNIAEIAVQSQKDSKALKALTLIATMYLPATLLATLFSSNLIQVQPKGSTDTQSTQLAVSPQFWIYVVATLTLTIATFVSIIWLEKRKR